MAQPIQELYATAERWQALALEANARIALRLAISDRAIKRSRDNLDRLRLQEEADKTKTISR